VGASYNGSYQTLVEHWDGTSWGIVASPNPSAGNSLLEAVTPVPHTNTLWAVGHFGSPEQTLTEYWDGSIWSIVPSPNVGSGSNDLPGVAADSKREGWAVGAYVDSSGVSHTLIEQWDGSSWSVVPSPNVGSGSNVLQAVTLVPHPGPSTLWAVGYFFNSSGVTQTLTVFHC
jgi:hypothetical protein